MSEKLFDKLYNQTKEVFSAPRKILVKEKVSRGFDSAIGSMKDAQLSLRERQDNLRLAVANGDVSKIKSLSMVSLELREIVEIITSVAAEKELFF